MSAEKAIHHILTNTLGVTNIVGDRVYPKTLPQPPILPAIIYTRVSGPRISSLQGASGLAHPRFQIDVFSEDYVEAKNLVRQVQLALEGRRGTFNGVDVQGVLFEGDRDMNDDVEGSLVTDQHRVTMDFIVWHRE